jgi:hypothetical protein
MPRPLFQIMNIHQSSYYPTLYSLHTESVNKQHINTNTTLSSRKPAKANNGSIYVCIRRGPEIRPLHRDHEWSIVLLEVSTTPYKCDALWACWLCYVLSVYYNTSCFVPLRIHLTEHSSLKTLFVNPMKQREKFSLNAVFRSPVHILWLILYLQLRLNDFNCLAGFSINVLKIEWITDC